jgi:hypothetical protein
MKGTGISLSFHPRLDPPPSEGGELAVPLLNSYASRRVQIISQEISDKPECLLTVDG